MNVGIKNLLFFPLAALKSLAVAEAMPAFFAPDDKCRDPRLASEKNTCVNFAQILPWRTINAPSEMESEGALYPCISAKLLSFYRLKPTEICMLRF